MKSDLMLPCRTMPDLEACLAAPIHSVPTVEYTVRNIELPIDNDTFTFLNQNEINFFATSAADRGGVQVYSKSRNLADATLTFETPFVLLGLCIYAYGESHAISIPANDFQTTAALANLPASPLTLRNDPALQAALFVGGVAPAGLSLCQAQIEHGHPTWEAIWAFMHAFRLVMRCPSSNYELLMDEMLADIGNCCSQFDYAGYGAHKKGHALIANRLNQRLNNITLPTGTLAGNPAVQIIPVNCEQHADGEIVSYRLAEDFTSWGRPETEGAVEQWYRLPCPIPFTPSTKVKISLNKAAGDEPYFDRMIEAMTYRPCLSPAPDIAGNNCNFPIAEDGVAPLQAGGIACSSYVPSGIMRVGIGLKGFQVRGSCVEELAGMISGKSYSEIARTYPGLVGGGGGIVRTPYQGQGVCVPAGSLGEPTR